MAVSSAVGEVVYQLDRERQVAASVVSVAGSGLNEFLEQGAASDAAIAVYRQRRGELDVSLPGVARLVGPLDEQLGLLPAFREQVKARQSSLTAVLVRYRAAIGRGLAVRESVGQVGGADGVLADQLRVAAALSQASEYAGVQRAAVVAGSGEVVSQAVQRELAATRAGFDEALLVVSQRSPAVWRGWLDQALSGEQVLAAQRIDDEVARVQVGQRLRVSTGRWLAASGERRDRLHEVQSRIDGDIVAEVGRQRSEQWWITGGLTVVAVVLLVAAAVFAWRQGRRLVQRLRGVRDAVTRMATDELPELVRRVEAADPADPGSVPAPPRVLAPAEARDEVDEVTAAFDSLGLTVYRTSSDLARQRQVVVGALEAVGRRCQGITQRLLAELDAAERNERDSATLEMLFRLDNLAAQLQHGTQSLLVLSGRTLGAVHDTPAELVTVVQGAQSRIQQYQRVEIGAVDGRVLVPTALIDDLVHLLASLLDNATRFTPGTVLITGHLLGDRVLVQVTDSGQGIDPELLNQLNGELAASPRIGVDHIRRQGVATVALLAAVHGLRVRLLPASPHGTVAEVEIPADRLTIRVPEQKTQPAGAGPIAGRRAPGGTPASALSLPVGPAAGPAGPVAGGAWPPVRAADAATQPLPQIPRPRSAQRQEPPPIFKQAVRDHGASGWFEPGGTVQMPATTAVPPSGDATTENGLPRRQPQTTIPPPVLPAPAETAPNAEVDTAGLSRTAAAYQRGLGRRPHQLREGQR
ncbi:nitrate- and nitrite sensing domain-containing protein [Micromonospora sp. WMMD1082]|uniref:sensor histidine kinase n=1 Tax=Micromonospora sp. WMMD1082 TaxID=3016104 RepID=UPI0024159C81|nr:nitrate- and nitrite sensing domain-containing protein [Micromonospora sp. WMMD1082]MDG4795502.1 nitrate- and nitrite sensing domain-containing protein [Micromonospora sp. WMMD1082]